MSYYIEITNIKGFANKQFLAIQNLAQEQIKEIALRTEQAIKQNIDKSITRANSTGNLKKSFFAEPIISINPGWGIGNINYLNQFAPYWRHVNYGSQAIGANWQHRVPKGEFQPGNNPPINGANGQRWESQSNARYSFIPTRPIAPLNYIQKTVAEIPKIVLSVLNKRTTF